MLLGLNFRQWKTTDELNSVLSLTTLFLLKKHNRELFQNLDLLANDSVVGVLAVPPFRWEKHRYSFNEGNVDVILDVGHNPAAIEAIGKRLQMEYPQRTYKYERLSYNANTITTLNFGRFVVIDASLPCQEIRTFNNVCVMFQTISNPRIYTLFKYVTFIITSSI